MNFYNYVINFNILTIYVQYFFIILTVQSLFILYLYTNKIALKFTLLKTTH